MGNFELDLTSYLCYTFTTLVSIILLYRMYGFCMALFFVICFGFGIHFFLRLRCFFSSCFMVLHFLFCFLSRGGFSGRSGVCDADSSRCGDAFVGLQRSVSGVSTLPGAFLCFLRCAVFQVFLIFSVVLDVVLVFVFINILRISPVVFSGSERATNDRQT